MSRCEAEPVLRECAGAHRDSLIPILQAVQERNGYLSRAALVSDLWRSDPPVSNI
jgi:NADH:ubiquinone oxidoreductase subunit E